MTALAVRWAPSRLSAEQYNLCTPAILARFLIPHRDLPLCVVLHEQRCSRPDGWTDPHPALLISFPIDHDQKEHHLKKAAATPWLAPSHMQRLTGSWAVQALARPIRLTQPLTRMELPPGRKNRNLVVMRWANMQEQRQ